MPISRLALMHLFLYTQKYSFYPGDIIPVVQGLEQAQMNHVTIDMINDMLAIAPQTKPELLFCICFCWRWSTMLPVPVFVKAYNFILGIGLINA